MIGARIARRIRVSGKVQGVWFRAWTVEQARAMGVDGWVRNRSDGSVEIVAAGPDDVIAAFVARCREGSPASLVERVDVEVEAGEIAKGFRKVATL